MGIFRPLAGLGTDLVAVFVCATDSKQERIQPDSNTYFFITQNSGTS